MMWFQILNWPRQLPSKKTQWVRGKRGNPQRTCSSRQQVQNYVWCLGCVGNQRFCEKFSVSLFFSKSLRWWTQKSGKSLLLPPAVDTIAKIPLRGKGLLCSIIISNVLLETINISKHSLRPLSHILHKFLRLYCKTFLSQGFPVKHFNFKMNWLVRFYDSLTLWCSLQSIFSIHMKNYWDLLETN